MLTGSRQRAKPEPRRPEGLVGGDCACGVLGLLCQLQLHFPELARRLERWPRNITPPQTKQDVDKLWRLAHPRAQGACLDVGALHLGRCMPFSHELCRAEGDNRVKACWV